MSLRYTADLTRRGELIVRRRDQNGVGYVLSFNFRHERDGDALLFEPTCLSNIVDENEVKAFLTAMVELAADHGITAAPSAFDQLMNDRRFDVA